MLYLGVQIRRSDKTARAESPQSVIDGYRDRSGLHGFTNSEVPDLFAKGLTDFDQLNASKKRRFFYLISENVFQTQQAMQVFQQGLLPQVDYEAWLYYMAILIRTPGGNKIWPYIATTITPTVRAAIDDYPRPRLPGDRDLARTRTQAFWNQPGNDRAWWTFVDAPRSQP